MSNLKQVFVLAAALCTVPLGTLACYAGETHSSSMAQTQSGSEAPPMGSTTTKTTVQKTAVRPKAKAKTWKTQTWNHRVVRH
jgi:hypothetical protein